MAQTKYSIEQYLLQLQFTIEQFGTVYSTVHVRSAPEPIHEKKEST